MPEMEARPPAENRHGGAPRGERPASWDGAAGAHHPVAHLAKRAQVAKTQQSPCRTHREGIACPLRFDIVSEGWG